MAVCKILSAKRLAKIFYSMIVLDFGKGKDS